MSDEKNENESRLGYVNLPGAQGLETAVGRPMAVFGSDEEETEPVLLPDAKMTMGHFVVFPKAFAAKASPEMQAAFEARMARNERSASWQQQHQAVVVGRVSRNREPARHSTYREGRFVIPPLLAEGATVNDAQAAFYVASTEMRTMFVEFSKQTMRTVHADLRQMATLVTIVDTAIHARPLGWDPGREEEYEKQGGDRGFEVVAEFRQFVTLGMPQSEIREFRIYSEHGEYPVWVPKDVEMGMLLRMDRQVMLNPPEIKHDMTRQERAARLMRKLQGV